MPVRSDGVPGLAGEGACKLSSAFVSSVGYCGEDTAVEPVVAVADDEVWGLTMAGV